MLLASMAGAILYLLLALPAGDGEPDGSKVTSVSASEQFLFPRVDDVPDSDLHFSFNPQLPVPRKSNGWQFGLAKLAIITAFMLFWLRGMNLCVSSSSEQESRVGISALFGIGLAGALAALLLPFSLPLPFYLPLAGILVATQVVPFGLYLRGRKRQPAVGALPRWQDFFSLPLASTGLASSSAFKTVPLELSNTEAKVPIVQPVAALRGSPTNEVFVGADSRGDQLMRSLVGHAVASRATDLHISTKLKHVSVQQRVDGLMIHMLDLPLDVGLALINVFKVMGELSIADRRRPQDGSFRVDVDDRRLSLRVSSQGTESGEKLSIRILDPAKTFPDFSSLGMPLSIQERLDAEIKRPHGLILFVGATGAGKSTTACAALQTIDSNERNVVTIEDPIEYQIASVDQIEVNSRAGQTFETALRSVLRLDADVIFVGEVRDEETAKIACRAAMTGQLVLATMHASDAVSGGLRMAELGVDLHNVASCLRAVLAQTLVRTLCLDCRVPYRLDAEKLEELGIPDFDGDLFRNRHFTSADAHCPSCNDRGFLRRTGVFELMRVSPVIREQFRAKAPLSTIFTLARENGMTTLREEGLRLLCDGKISLEEFNRVLDA